MMEVNTGAILGMAVEEGYDLNDPFTLVNQTAKDEIAQLPEDEKAAAGKRCAFQAMEEQGGQRHLLSRIGMENHYFFHGAGGKSD